MVALGGEIDMAVAQEFAEQAMGALADCPDESPVVVIDLGAVTFLDSSGIGAVVQIRRRAVERGQSVKLRGRDERVMRVLEMSGVDSLFEIESAESPSEVEPPAS